MNLTVIAIAVGAVFVAIVVVSGLVTANSRLNDVIAEIRSWKAPDHGEIGRRLATEQRPLPEIVEVSRPVAAAPAPIIWGGTLQQAESFRRTLGLSATQCMTTSDGSLRSIEGRRVHVVFVVGTAGLSPDGQRMRDVLARSGVKSTPSGALFIDFRKLRVASDA